MHPGACGRERLEAGGGRRVGGVESPSGGDVAVGVAGEQQPSERRVAAVPRAGPPDDGLVLGPGERDVGQPQVLAPLLDQALGPVGG